MFLSLCNLVLIGISQSYHFSVMKTNIKIIQKFILNLEYRSSKLKTFLKYNVTQNIYSLKSSYVIGYTKYFEHFELIWDESVK